MNSETATTLSVDISQGSQYIWKSSLCLDTLRVERGERGGKVTASWCGVRPNHSILISGVGIFLCRVQAVSLYDTSTFQIRGQKKDTKFTLKGLRDGLL